MTPKKDEKTEEKDLDFEGRLGELEKLVEKLESGELNLDDSLAEYQRGVRLARDCSQHLEQARQLIEELSDVDDESTSRAVDDER